MKYFLVIFLVGQLFAQIQVIPEGEGAFTQAMAMERAGKIEAAKQIYKKILEGNPSQQPSYFQLKNIYTKSGDLKAAISLVQSWLIDNPQDLQSELILGEFYFKNQQQDIGLAIWNSFRKTKLTNQTTYRLLFHTYARFGQVEAMESLARDGRKKFKEPHFFAIDLANYYQSRQTFDRSLREYMTLIRHQKQYLRYSTDRILLMSDDTTTHALIDSTLRASAEVNPNVRSILAGFYYKTGQFNNAFIEHQLMGMVGLEDTKRWLTFAENLRKEKQQNLSIKSYHYLLQNLNDSEPNTVGKALLGLGQAFEDQIIQNQTELIFVKWFPDNDFFQNQFIKSPNIRNDPLANTLEHYQSILAMLPPSNTTATVHYRLGEIQSRMMRDYQGAKISYNAALKARPNQKLMQKIKLRIGDLLLSSGEYERAVQYFMPKVNQPINESTILYLTSLLFKQDIDKPMAFLDSVTLTLSPNHGFFNDLLEIHDLIINYYADGTKDDQSAFKLFFKAEALIRQYKIPEGIAELQNLINQHPDALITPLSSLRLAILLIEFDQIDSAYKVAMSIENTPLKDQSLVLSGEIEERFHGNTQNALIYYHRILSECPTSLLLEPVRIHIRKLSQTQES